jgi:hypothetical protein
MKSCALPVMYTLPVPKRTPTTPPRFDICLAFITVFPSFGAQTGAMYVCALPVTLSHNITNITK